MRRRARRLGPIACAVALGAFALPAVAGAETFHASPTGDDPGCSANFPCSLETALLEAGGGDAVALAGGKYAMPPGGVEIDENIDFGGRPGNVAALLAPEIQPVRVVPGVDATLHDLRIEGGTWLDLGSASAERLFVSSHHPDESVCSLEPGALLRDSVCWGHPNEGGAEPKVHALAINALGPGVGVGEPVVLRNVTAYTTAKSGNAIHALGAAGGRLAVDAGNVIARASRSVDVVARYEGEGSPESILSLTNSSFETFEDGPTEAAVVTEPHMSGNQIAAPHFANPGDGDFHVLGESPTIDAALVDPALGRFDADGRVRALARCLGGAALPDIGAYERSSEACPTPPPPPPPPPGPIKPIFRIVSIDLNRRSGAGQVYVEVPGSGVVSLTGSGVKLVRRNAPAEGGMVALPIQPWVITRVRLAKSGKTWVRLTVTFDGQPNGEWSKAFRLRKKRARR